MKQKKQENQNKIFAIGFALIFIVIGWSVARSFFKAGGGGQNSEQSINAEILKAPSISPDDLMQKVVEKEKLVVIDVRSAAEFESGHISASQNSPAGENEIQNNILKGMDKTSDVIFVNQGENVFETAKLANSFVSKGYANAKYLQGGFSAWQEQAFPVVSGGGAQSDEAKVKTMNVDQLAEDLNIGEASVQFLDVRDQASFQEEHIKGAVNIPLKDLETNSDKLSGVKKIIIYGKDEEQAKKAAVTLFDLNFFNAYVLEGSIDAVKNAGN